MDCKTEALQLNSQGHESIEDLRVVHELKNMRNLLQEENEKYQEQIKKIAAELEGINISTAETEDYIAGYKGKREFVVKNLKTLNQQRNRLTEELNRLRLQMKTAANDLEAAVFMQETLSDEYETIRREKEIIINRLKDVESGIKTICREKSGKVPMVRERDEIVNRIYQKFKEAENRMEVAIQFKMQ